MCYVSDKPRPVILHIVPEGSHGDTQNRSSLGFDVTWPMPWPTTWPTPGEFNIMRGEISPS